MAHKLKIRGPAGCCACDQTDGCGCASGLGCGLMCQSKSSVDHGVATICGYDEFDTPSVPPKKYRKRTVQSSGLFVICDSHADDCGDPACPSEYQGSGVNQVIFGTNVSWSAELIYSGPAGPGVSNYLFTGAGTLSAGGAATLILNVSGSGSDYHNGDTVPITNGTGSATVSVNFIFKQSLDSKCLQAGGPLRQVTGDDWDIESEYNASICVSASVDNSSRLTKSGGFTCDPSEGVSGSIPGSDPATVYGANATAADSDKTHRSIVGVGCTGQVSYGGTVDETLSIEDTERDAIDRANSSGPDWGSSNCATEPAFITERSAGELSFEYRAVRVRGTVGSPVHPLVVGHSYTATIRFERRPLGSVIAFTVIGLQEIIFTATAAEDVTPWIDVPNQAGQETRARSCFYIVTP